MVDLDRIGGVPVVLRVLLDAGLLHGDVMTVTGKTMAENLADVVVRSTRTCCVPSPIRWPTRAASPSLRGSLSPGGAVVKIAGIDLDVFEGRPGSSTTSSMLSTRSISTRSTTATSS